MDFRVNLDIFRGPLDLLLYLVRKHELEIENLPVATIARQYSEYLEVLQQLDINAVGDFLEMASILLEIKSKQVLPQQVEESEAQIEDPREELVQRLLDYKKFRDAATMLDDYARRWQQRYPRRANDLPVRKIDPMEQPIHEVEPWDLVSAFSRVMRESAPPPVTNIIYDETPITAHMARIHEVLATNGRASFTEMFDVGLHKSAMIGIFLAILELVRHHNVVTSQEDEHGEIWIYPGEHFSHELDLSQVDHYDTSRVTKPGDPASLVK